MEISTVPSVFVSALVDSAVRCGFSAVALLGRLDISPELLAQDKARIPAQKFAEFTDAIIAGLQDEQGGLSSHPLKPGTFAMMCYACIHCATLGAFLERCAKFYDIISDATGLDIACDNDQASLVFRVKDDSHDPAHLLPMITLGVLHRLSSWLIRQNIVLESASLAHPRPEYAAAYHIMFRSPVLFDQPLNSLTFHSNYLDMPIKQDERALEDFLQTPGLVMMTSPDPRASHVARVRDLISGSTRSEFPDFEWVAQQFYTTTGTLRRRLRDEGTSYQQLKDDLRRDTAIFNLDKGHMSIEEVAASVGFAEPTSFFRAFKRWTGVTPRAYIARR